MVAAFALTACDTDSSTSAKNDETPVENPTKPSDSTTVHADLDSTAVNGILDSTTVRDISEDTVDDSVGTASPVEEDVAGLVCTIQETSANSFVMTVNEDDFSMTITTVLTGDEIEYIYESVYDEPVSGGVMLPGLCEDDKRDVESYGSTVVCEKHAITMRETEETDMTYDEVLARGKATCDDMNSN